MFLKTKGVFLGLAMLLLFPSIAPAQWVFVGRKALGLISRIANEAQGHETASVLLEADAAKVFAAAEKIISEKPENQVLSKNDADQSISFMHGSRAITLKVERLQDDLAQILVVSSGGNSKQDAAYVINGILRICKEVGAHCWQSNE